MAAHFTIADEAEAGSPELAESLRYVARQPILDLRGRVHAYELLFRNAPEGAFCGDGDLATRTMLDNTVIFGLDRLTSGLPAFVNCTRDALIGNLVSVLPTNMTVLEILEDVDPTPDLVKACVNLKSSGFRLALDDFIWRSSLEPLVELADYIKVDFTLSKAPARRQMLKRLSRRGAVMLAEKVETQDEYKQACDEGFELFQGYYFCRPTLFKNRKVPVNHLSQIEILRALQGKEIDLREISRLVKRDASLTYRLLRLVNSPLTAMRKEVRSVQEALLATGEGAFRRIATLAITSELNADRPAEILRMAFVRGRFCELAAEFCALDSTEQYLLGLLSLLPAMLRLPMDELAPSLPLREEIRIALLGAPVMERCFLDWIVCHERGDWNACDDIASVECLKQGDLMRFYGEAVVWAESVLSFT